MNKSEIWHNGRIEPKPGTYFRIDERIYKAIDDGGRYGCDRCVFNLRTGEDSGCKAPENLICKGLYFDDDTHRLSRNITPEAWRNRESKRMYWLATAVAAMILIGIYIYKIIEN